ncbi:MAG TPA: SDR family oxidoreductase [Solirubrobacterales bacterium]|nr:SDR family oxidoreductase [Solirubrobacterales bacterium]
MTVAVVGGTGTIGARVVTELLGRGEEVRVLSRNDAGVPAGAAHHPVNLTDGAGLAAALVGTDTVLDAVNSTRRSKQTLVAGTERLLEAGAAAGVAHHLAISIVGIESIPLGYYRDKVAQERAIEAGPLPWSILRATQFHQLLDGAFGALARFGVRPTGTAKLQPIDPDVVAVRLADAALGAPAGRLPEIAGPRVATLSELSRTWADARGLRLRLPLRLPAWGRVGRGLAAGALCAPDAATPGADFEAWLGRHRRPS